MIVYVNCCVFYVFNFVSCKLILLNRYEVFVMVFCLVVSELCILYVLCMWLFLVNDI